MRILGAEVNSLDSPSKPATSSVLSLAVLSTPKMKNKSKTDIKPCVIYRTFRRGLDS